MQSLFYPGRVRRASPRLILPVSFSPDCLQAKSSYLVNLTWVTSMSERTHSPSTCNRRRHDEPHAGIIVHLSRYSITSNERVIISTVTPGNGNSFARLNSTCPERWETTPLGFDERKSARRQKRVRCLRTVKEDAWSFWKKYSATGRMDGHINYYIFLLYYLLFYYILFYYIP